MDRKASILLGITMVLLISGCTNSTFSGQVLNAESDTKNEYKCPTGEYVSDATECPYVCPTGEKVESRFQCPSYCGDRLCNYGENSQTCPEDCPCGNGRCDPGENQDNCPSDCCIGAEIVIQGATYDSEILTLFVNNVGDVDLKINVKLFYSDDSADVRAIKYNVKRNAVETITLSDVRDNLEEAWIYSMECPEPKDKITNNWINGL